MRVPGIPDPLRERDFALYFAARLATMLGTAMAPIGLAFAVLQATGKGGDLGFTLAARTTPFVVLALFGGVVADRFPRQRVMWLSDLGSAAGQATTAAYVLAGGREVGVLVVLQALSGAANAFYFPAAVGIVPQIVRQSHRRQANALVGLARNTALVSGAALGGVIASFANPGWSLVADAATFLLSAALTVRIRHTGAVVVGSTMWRDLVAGWSEFRSRTWLWAVVAQFAIVLGLGRTALQVLGPVVARDRLGGAVAWGVLLSVQAAGNIGGGVVLLRLPAPGGMTTAVLAVLTDAALLVGLAAAWPLAALALLAVLDGVGTQVFGVMWETTMQSEVPPAALSRVSAYDAIGSLGLMPVGYAVIGPLSDALGVRGALLVGVGAVVLPTLAVLAVPEIHRVGRHAPRAGSGDRLTWAAGPAAAAADGQPAPPS
jgi:predicted MFS family arabinose efflux permease